MTSKVKVGDKIHVEFIVSSVFGDAVCGKRQDFTATYSFPCDSPAIVKHVPKPYEPEAGHVVCNQGGFHWKVLAVNSGRAWCRSTDCNDERLFDFNQLTFYGFGDDKS